MSDVQPWHSEFTPYPRLEEDHRTIRDHLGEVVVCQGFTEGLWIDPKHLRTLLNAPVYEAIVRDLAEASEQVYVADWMDCVARIQERARAALAVETEE